MLLWVLSVVVLYLVQHGTCLTFSHGPTWNTTTLNLVGRATIIMGNEARLTDVGFPGALWHKQPVPLANGFESSFVFRNTLFRNDPPGDGLAIVFQNNAQGASMLGLGGSYLCYRDQVNTSGGYLLWHPAPTGSIGFDSFGMFGEINTGMKNVDTLTAHFLLNDTNTHEVFTSYNALNNVFSMYIDGQPGFSRALPSSFSSFIGNKDTAYVGLTASVSGAYHQPHYIASWRFTAYERTVTMTVASTKTHTIYRNGVVIGSGPSLTIPPVYRSADQIYAAILPGDVIAVQAASNAPGPSSLIATIFYNGAPVDISSVLWKCSNTNPGNWTGVSYDDSAWANAVVQSTNAMAPSPFIPIGNMRGDAAWIWATNTNQPTYCRYRVPLDVCTDNSTCPYSNSYCDGVSYRCACRAPWTGASCSMFDVPTINTISVPFGPNTGNTYITIQGRTFSPNGLRCHFSSAGVDFFTSPLVTPSCTTLAATSCTLVCVSPPRTSPPTSTVQLYLENYSPQPGQSTISNSLSFSYVLPITLTSVSIDDVRPDVPFTLQVTGTGFASTGRLACRFERVVLPGVYISDTSMSCNSPTGLSPGKYVVEASTNGQDYVHAPNGAATLYVHQAVSPYCRGYVGEIPFARDLRVQSGVPYYLPVLVSLPSLGSSIQPGAQTIILQGQGGLADADLCCAINLNLTTLTTNHGELCGVNFPAVRSASPSYASINVTLPQTAYVNQIDSTWALPCANMPPSYQIWANIPARGGWVHLLDRETDGLTACSTIAGDAGSVGVCLDYVSPPQNLSAVSIVWDNAITQLPEGSDGGWLFETRVHGVYPSDPYFIRAVWRAGAMPSLPSDDVIPVPAMSVTLLNISGASVPASSYAPVVLRARLVGSTSSSVLQGTTSGSFDASLAIFNDLTLQRPGAGTYTIVVEDVNGILQPASLNLTVSAGAAASLQPIPPFTGAITLPTLKTASLPPIKYYVTDRAGNAAQDGTVLTLMFPGVLGAPVSGRVLGGVVSFNVTLSSPAHGVYSVPILLGALPLGVVSLSVVAGPPSMLVASLPGAQPNTTFTLAVVASPYSPLPAVQIYVADAAGSVLDPADDVVVLVEALDVRKRAPPVLNGTISQEVTTSVGAAFSDLALQSPTIGSFSLVFRAGVLDAVVLHLSVLAGPATSLRVVSPSVPVSVPANDTSPLPDIVIQATDALGNPAPPSPSILPVKITLSSLQSLSSASPTAALMPGSGLVTFTGVAFDRPAPGTYTLVFLSSSLAPTSLSVTVVVGSNINLVLQDYIDVTAPCSNRTQVPPGPRLCAYSYGAVLLPSVVLHVTATSPTSPVTSSLVLSGGCVALHGAFSPPFYWVAPTVGVHTITFSAVNATSADLNVTVTPGLPRYVKVVPPYPEAVIPGGELSTLVPQPTLLVVDIGGNPVTPGQRVSIAATISTTINPREFKGDLLTNATVNSRSQVQYNDLSIFGQLSTRFVLTFSIVGASAGSTNATLPVSTSSCDVIRAFSQPSPDGMTCECSAGYEYDTFNNICSFCPVATFKDTQGNDPCYPCPPAHTTLGVASISEQACLCAVGHYEAYADGTNTSTLCKDCPLGARCANNTIQGNADGFWQAPDGSFLLCPNPLACTSLSVCAPGFDPSSPMCMGCDTPNGYGPQAQHQCASCPDPWRSWLPMVVVWVFLAVILGRNLLFFHQTDRYDKEVLTTKIVISHLHHLGLLAALGTAWGMPLESAFVLGAISSFIDLRVLVVACALPGTPFTQVLGFVLIPIIALGIGLLGWIVEMIMVNRQTHNARQVAALLLSRWLVIPIAIGFVLHPTIVLQLLRMLKCAPLGSLLVVETIPSISCTSPEYLSFLPFLQAFLIIYALVGPLAVLALLFYAKRTDGTAVHPLWRETVRFLAGGHKDNRRAWEFFEISRKVLMCLVVAFARSSLSHQLYGLVWISVVALIAHVMLRPHYSMRQLRLEFWSLLVTVVTLSASLYLISNNPASPGAISVSVMLFVLNIGVVLLGLFLLTRAEARRSFPTLWSAVPRFSKKVDRGGAKSLPQLSGFFRNVGELHDADEISQLARNVENWWIQAPVYKRKRLTRAMKHMMQGTDFETSHATAEYEPPSVRLTTLDEW
eukprot:TRINITY_DN2556_c0_g1_i1.p1 TRINITY_DN2556_c0_g1~~TRINITY_DN2556_c0_g1_i1.p1  ORF type:complete len:2113 (+),score=507.05 TRINITY_DN2556_c0_g1_i1:35-6373(+)